MVMDVRLLPPSTAQKAAVPVSKAQGGTAGGVECGIHSDGSDDSSESESEQEGEEEEVVTRKGGSPWREGC